MYICLVEVKLTRNFLQTCVVFLEKVNFNQIQIHQNFFKKMSIEHVILDKIVQKCIAQ